MEIAKKIWITFFTTSSKSYPHFFSFTSSKLFIKINSSGLEPINLNIVSVEILKVNEELIPVVQKLAREIWDEHYIKILSQEQIDYMLALFYSDEKIKTEIASGTSWEMLYDNDLPVGYLVCEPKTNRMYLSKIYLKDSVRGKGYGKLLINRAIELSRQENKNAIYLNVNKYNTGSISFYERLGFKKIAEGVFDIGNGYVMDDFIYEFPIGE